MQSGFARGEGGLRPGIARVHAVEIRNSRRALGSAEYRTACNSAPAIRLPYRPFDPLLDMGCPDCREIVILSA
jgi:hypothetical protein